jgi:hypothetical protein
VENLEERTLLSATATVSESDVGGVPTVTVEIKGVDHTYTPPSGAAFQFNRNGFTVNILNTSAEIPVIVAGIDDTVNVGDAGSLAGIDAPVTFAPRSGYRTLNINDSAATTKQTASLDFTASSQGSVGNPGTLAITGLSPAAINFVKPPPEPYPWSNSINVSTTLGNVTWSVPASGMASASGLAVHNGRTVINAIPTNPTAAAGTNYEVPPTGVPLFRSGGPSYLDVAQGGVGDCWLLAGLAEVAARTPQAIRNMFIYEGSVWDASASSDVGIYLVRFFNSAGAARFVQVSTLLPDGGTYYDNVMTGLGTQALWVALAEKAYADANGFGYVTTDAKNQDSYAALDGGWSSWALGAITGKSANEYSTSSANVASKWGQRDLVVLGTQSPKSANIAGLHAYALVAYNASSSKPFEIFNPWGTTSGSATPENPAPYAPDATEYGLFWANAKFIKRNFAINSGLVFRGVGRIDCPALRRG